MTDKILINIGRQYGSGGKSVALCLGEKMGVPVYDDELLRKAAQDSGLSAELFRDTDEKRRVLSLGSLFGVNRYGGYSSNPMGDGELFRMQSETIRGIASKGSGIFIGRASDYVLRDFDCLDVFICAPMKARVERVMSRLSLDAAKAEKEILRRDAGRKEYYNCFTLEHWGMASNYDLCVDSSLLGIEGTAGFIADFYNRIYR